VISWPLTIPGNPKKWRAQELHDAHALAIGRLVIAWNNFQEQLAELFARLFGKERWDEALAAWQALVNDGAQRDMLVAVARSKLGDESPAFKKILWISEQAKQQLADNRNFGIHTPLMIFTDIDGTTNIFPSDIFGNVRARSSKIRDKDLVELFSTYELQIRKMTTFALAVGFHISDPEVHPLPDKPDLQFPPHRGTPKA
jgi:hypothetical protein